MAMTRAEFTTAVAKEHRTLKMEIGVQLADRFGRGGRFVAWACEDGKAGVFGVGGIGGGTLAEEE
jgi:hypothetical protein